MIAEISVYYTTFNKIDLVQIHRHRIYILWICRFFYPLSILNLLDVNKIPQWSIYSFQQLNVFEGVYWLVLTYGNL